MRIQCKMIHFYLDFFFIIINLNLWLVTFIIVFIVVVRPLEQTRILHLPHTRASDPTNIQILFRSYKYTNITQILQIYKYYSDPTNIQILSVPSINDDIYQDSLLMQRTQWKWGRSENEDAVKVRTQWKWGRSESEDASGTVLILLRD